MQQCFTHIGGLLRSARTGAWPARPRACHWPWLPAALASSLLDAMLPNGPSSPQRVVCSVHGARPNPPTLLDTCLTKPLQELSDDVPDHEHFDSYGPNYQIFTGKVHLRPCCVKAALALHCGAVEGWPQLQWSCHGNGPATVTWCTVLEKSSTADRDGGMAKACLRNLQYLAHAAVGAAGVYCSPVDFPLCGCLCRSKAAACSRQQQPSSGGKQLPAATEYSGGSCGGERCRCFPPAHKTGAGRLSILGLQMADVFVFNPASHAWQHLLEAVCICMIRCIQRSSLKRRVTKVS